MTLCETCPYKPWDSSNPITEEDYLERLEGVEVIPSREGPERVCVGSPFRVPLPENIVLCCLDKQICDKQEVNFTELDNTRVTSAKINAARVAVYQEAGLPDIG